MPVFDTDEQKQVLSVFQVSTEENLWLLVIKQYSKFRVMISSLATVLRARDI